MDNFCGSEFWDSTVTWWTENPEFTPCFQRTVLLWFPCAFLWMNSLFEIFYIKNSINRHIPYGFLSRTKLLLTSALIAMSIVDISVVFSNEDNREMHPVDYCTPIIKIATFILSAILLDFNRRFGIRTSGLQFLFWVFLLVCGVPQLRSQLKGKTERKSLGINDKYEEYNFISYLVFYVISFVIWALNCFADKAPLKTKYPKTEKPCPETEASFLSRIFFAWFDPLLWKGFKRPLKSDDLWDINPEYSAKEIMPIFLQNWDKSVAKANALPTKNGKKQIPSIVSAIYKTFGSKLTFPFQMELFRIILIVIPPQLIRLIILFASSSPSNSPPTDETDISFYNFDLNMWSPLWHGIFYAVLLLIVTSVQTIIMYQNLQRLNFIGFQTRTALIGMIYRKALCLTSAARKKATVSRIIKLLVIDVEHIVTLIADIDRVWSAPLQIFIVTFFLWNLLGPSVLAGIAVILALMPLNSYIRRKKQKLQFRQMKIKDERVKLMNEILNGMEVLKMNAWEQTFVDQVLKMRETEIQTLKKSVHLFSGSTFLWSFSPFVVSLVSFAVFVLSSDENILDARVAFVSIILFNILSGALNLFPFIMSKIVRAKKSVTRINKFLNHDELDPQNVSHDLSDDTPLSIENGTFSWVLGVPILRNIDLKVKKGELVAVTGLAGSGKSSIVSAILGEMEKISGRVNTIGTIAYVSQQAWIQNATIQDNILFGKPMDRKRYNQIIEACALKPDLELLPSGDATEIGEKGANLSGGQKQRVALARAVYSDADIYLLDDPLSSVDSHVDKHIFENVIGPNGVLAMKTRLLVTQRMFYSSNFDNIYEVKNGRITESELIRKKRKPRNFYTKYLESPNKSKKVSKEIKKKVESEMNINSDMGVDGILQHANDTSNDRSLNRPSSRSLGEKHSQSSIQNNESDANPSNFSQKSKNSNENNNSHNNEGQSDDEYLDDIQTSEIIENENFEVEGVKSRVYMQYLKTVGAKFIMLTIILNLISQSFTVGSYVWLSRWSVFDSVEEAKNVFLQGYAAFGLGIAFSSVLSAFVSALGFLFAAIKLHNALLNGVIHAPMQFFDQTPIGRVLSRFSQDVGILDNRLPKSIIRFIGVFYKILAIILVIGYSTPIFFTVAVPLGILYCLIHKFYTMTSRQLKRLESKSKSPIFSHFTESIQGASTIRAFNVIDRFIVESEQKVDNNQMFAIPMYIGTSWKSVRLELIGNLIVFFAVFFAILHRDELNAGAMGLSLIFALQITSSLNSFIRHASAIETNMVSVERIKEYAETKQEADWLNPNANVSENWPEHGTVEFKNVDLRYRDGLDLALRNLTFTINASEKVGIVERTRAGKSSLTLGLFRIIEAAGGSIVIDGQDISKLGLHTLRSKLTIIPQDPVLFSGSLRINLDPFDEKTDAEIWHALELAHLKTYISERTIGLNHKINEGGANLSVGQRQLICLARALLRKTKVLVFDEATASVDRYTDYLVRRTIRREFKECTILTIAHRLKTIMDSDKVIVLDKGQVIEFDAPTELLKNENSVFYSMAKEVGLNTRQNVI